MTFFLLSLLSSVLFKITVTKMNKRAARMIKTKQMPNTGRIFHKANEIITFKLVLLLLNQANIFNFCLH